jgi:hypothetical protein
MFKETDIDIDDFTKSMKLELTIYDKEKINTTHTKELLRKIKDNFRLFNQWYEKGDYDTCYQKLIELTLQSIILLSRTEVLLRLKTRPENVVRITDLTFDVIENETIVFPIGGTIEERIAKVFYKGSEYYLSIQICTDGEFIYRGIAKSLLPKLKGEI